MQNVGAMREAGAANGLTERQGAVLEQALRLLVDGGEKALTTAGVARAANCSKESLYKWFGDREGLLSAMIAFQASKVRTLDVSAAKLDGGSLRVHLVAFAKDLSTCWQATCRWRSTGWRSDRRAGKARSSATCCRSAAAADRTQGGSAARSGPQGRSPRFRQRR